MCVVLNISKQLLVIATVSGKLRAFDVESSNLEWEADSKLGGVMPLSLHAATISLDGQGQVLVCDLNNECIQLFFAFSGRYLRPVLRKNDARLQSVGEDQEPEKFLRIRSLEDSPSIAVAYKTKEKYYRSIIII